MAPCLLHEIQLDGNEGLSTRSILVSHRTGLGAQDLESVVGLDCADSLSLCVLTVMGRGPAPLSHE